MAAAKNEIYDLAFGPTQRHRIKARVSVWD